MTDLYISNTMTEEQIIALNRMSSGDSVRLGYISDEAGRVYVKLVNGDIRRGWFHWKLVYPTYDVDLYSDGVISSYDTSILRYMYGEWYKLYHHVPSGQLYSDDTTLNSI